MLKEGDKAPSFSLPDDQGKTVDLSDFAGKKEVVLFFFPKADTPG
jgi:peroxiredoxin Q/BCP